MVLYYNKQGEPITRDEWVALFEDMAYRRVGKTMVGDIEISTVWIGLGYSFPPLILETMVFGGPLDQEQWRWPNVDAALAGHDQVVAQVREAVGAVCADDPRS